MPRHAVTIESLPQAFEVVKVMPADGLGTGARAVAPLGARRWSGSSKPRRTGRKRGRRRRRLLLRNRVIAL